MSKIEVKQIQLLTNHLSQPQPELAKLCEKTTPRVSSTASSLLKYANKWQGQDLKECLEQVYKTRSQVKF